MRLVTFRTPQEKSKGLQFLQFIPWDTAYRFIDVAPGTVFHSRNVPEPFDLYFMSAQHEVLKKVRMVPEESQSEAPQGTSYVLETKAGAIV